MGSHYVPQKYLAGFEAPEKPGHIWMYDKKTRKTACPAIDKVAQERRYYTPEQEIQLAKEIEAPAHRVLDKLRRLERVTLEDRAAMGLYIATMFTRIPKRRRQAFELYPEIRENTLAEVESTLDAWAKSAPDESSIADRFAELDTIRAKLREGPPETIEEQIKEPWASDEIIARSQRMTWRLIVAPPDHIFISSDNPAYFFDSYGIGRPESEVTFPLSSDLALVANWQGPPGATLLVPKPPRSFVKEINRRIASGAERFIFSSKPKPWIATLAHRSNPSLSRIVW
jgi:hypothetical protein